VCGFLGCSPNDIRKIFGLKQFGVFVKHMMQRQNVDVLRHAIGTRHAFAAERQDWTNYVNALSGEDGGEQRPSIFDVGKDPEPGVEPDDWEDIH
jgi:hypothetical protein